MYLYTNLYIDLTIPQTDQMHSKLMACLLGNNFANNYCISYWLLRFAMLTFPKSYSIFNLVAFKKPLTLKVFFFVYFYDIFNRGGLLVFKQGVSFFCVIYRIL